MKQIVVKDETILTFYEQNKHLNFITMNHILIDILTKLSSNLNDTAIASTNTQILELLQKLSDDFGKAQNNTVIKIIEKIEQNKHFFVDEVKNIISNNTATNNDKLLNIVEKNNDMLLTKTQLMLTEIVPKSHETFHTHLNGSLQQMSNNIINETGKFIELATRDERSVKNYLDKIDAQFGHMANNIYQPIVTFMQSSEERTTNNITHLKDNVNVHLTAQNKLSTELNQFLNKYNHNSSIKGIVSESELYSVLQQIFPSDEIVECTGETATCDYRVNRRDGHKPTILFENKDYARTINTDEVLKFERDIKMQQQHGIFISQNSPITFKENFQIDIIDKYIHVYVANAKYCPNKIKIAVDIVDTIAQKLNVIHQTPNNNDTLVISNKDIVKLTDEYSNFTKQKNTIICEAKASHKLLIDSLEKLHFNSIKKILTANGILQPDSDFKCKFCVFIGKNKASLGAHMRKCEQNPMLRIEKKNVEDPPNLKLLP